MRMKDTAYFVILIVLVRMRSMKNRFEKRLDYFKLDGATIEKIVR